MKDKFLQSCQIETPIDIVDGMWQIAKTYAPHFPRVIDLGAGDGRFSKSSMYGRYTGYEVDKNRIPPKSSLPKNVAIINKDAFSSISSRYSLCMGNPPYIRANRLKPEWRDNVADKLQKITGIKFNRNVNLFTYFLVLALLRTEAKGLVIQLIPFEWVSRPSAKPIRDYIASKGWQVNVYRFTEDIFDNVLTTASITVIDKSKSDGEWRYYQLSKSFDAVQVLQPSGSSHKVLDYSKRHPEAHALRGLSPGSQDIFTMTEHERLFNGLALTDVTPCVTSLKPLPSSITSLTPKAFKKHYVDANEKCWLIRSDKENLSPNLKAYLDSIDEQEWGKFSTCTNRPIWWKYRIHPCGKLLVASGFTNFGPKIVRNSANVIALGSVYAIITKKLEYLRLLESQLRKKNFEVQVVSHSNNLKKIEIRQLNSVINDILNIKISADRENNVKQSVTRHHQFERAYRAC